MRLLCINNIRRKSGVFIWTLKNCTGLEANLYNLKLRRVQILSSIVRCCGGQFGKPSDAKEEVIAIGGEAHTVALYMGGAATVENTPLPPDVPNEIYCNPQRYMINPKR